MDKTYYAPSVHCSYYSVLQYMKFAVNQSIGISYEDQKSEIGRSKQNKFTSRGTHEYLIEKIESVIKVLSNEDFVNFNRKIKDLKLFRTRSDYENVDITFEQSHKSFRLAEELMKQLKQTFKV